MILGNFLHNEQSVFETGCEKGQWLVGFFTGEPCRVFQAPDTLAKGSQSVLEMDGGSKHFYSSRNAYLLDPDYTEDAVLALKCRARKEWDIFNTGGHYA